MSHKRLLKDFSFGFELEATYNRSQTNTDFLKEKFDELLNGTGNMHGDGSLRSPSGWSTFEYASPVIQFTPQNIKMVVDFFDKLPSLFVKTNRSCGLHTHISYKGINRNDIAWLMASMAADESYKKFKFMKRTRFYAEPYALATFFEEAHDILLDGNKSRFADKIVTNEKYRSMRIHPQGTLEWRGPRTFLNVNKHEKNVMFMKKLTEFIIKINQSLDLTEVKNLKKSDFLRFAESKIKYIDFKDDITKEQNKYEKLINHIAEKPIILNTLPDKIYNEMINYMSNNDVTFKTSLFAKNLKDNDVKLTSKTALEFCLKNCSIQSFIRFIDADLFKNNLDMVGNYNKLTPTFEFLIKNSGCNDEILKVLMNAALNNFGKSSIRTFTYNAMMELVKYQILAFKKAVSKDLTELFGHEKAYKLVSHVIQVSPTEFSTSEIYNDLMNSPNRNLLLETMPTDSTQVSVSTSVF